MRQLKISKSITNRETEGFQKYLSEIGKIDLLTPEEEVALAIRIQQGDRKALEKLAGANLLFVVSVAKQYQGKNFQLNDLVNEGNIGLIKAAEKFDHTRGFKFISYAVWWIRQSIMQFKADTKLIHLPLNKVQMSIKIEDLCEKFFSAHYRNPDAEELALMLDVPVEEVQILQQALTFPLSMDAPFQDSETSLHDIVCDSSQLLPDAGVVERESLKADVAAALQKLTPREREVIMMTFGIGYDRALNFEDIGGHLDLTRERVRQIHDKAVMKLRSHSPKKLLQKYLG